MAVRNVVLSDLHPVTDWMNYPKADIGAANLIGQIAQLGGRNAARDVAPLIVEQLDRFN